MLEKKKCIVTHMYIYILLIIMQCRSCIGFKSCVSKKKMNFITSCQTLSLPTFAVLKNACQQWLELFLEFFSGKLLSFYILAKKSFSVVLFFFFFLTLCGCQQTLPLTKVFRGLEREGKNSCWRVRNIGIGSKFMTQIDIYIYFFSFDSFLL